MGWQAVSWVSRIPLSSELQWQVLTRDVEIESGLGFAFLLYNQHAGEVATSGLLWAGAVLTALPSEQLALCLG